LNIFEKLTVVELASVLAGPAVGMFFAELGTKVIKVENPATGGDVTRSWRLPYEPLTNDISSYFAAVNWGKESITIDMTVSDGQAIVHRLIRQADIVITSFKPGDAQKLCMDYPTLSQINPSLIYAHITGYGTNDDRAGYDAVLQAATGFMHMNGEADGLPVKMPVALIDLLTAHQIKEGILVALLNRQANNRGAYIHASLFQSGVASLANQATNWLTAGHSPQRMGTEHPNIVPYGCTFFTKDGKPVITGVGNDKQFRHLCTVLGVPELADDPRFSTNPARVTNRKLLKEILQHSVAKFSRDAILTLCRKHKIPIEGILSVPEVFEQPAAANMIIRAEKNSHPIAATRTIAFQIDGSAMRYLSPPPNLNEHGEKILSTCLGLTQSEIKKLQKQKIFGKSHAK
jgi:crotonobetainyl-CoA:carnitine CoA-transferase CaiB-like acyl-CoA transferase